MEGLLREHPTLAGKIDALVAEGHAEWGTLMGFPCLRTGGAFFATARHDRPELVVKLPSGRVTELIEAGTGDPFAPAGRTFKEWIALPESSAGSWISLLDEARAFVAK